MTNEAFSHKPLAKMIISHASGQGNNRPVCVCMSVCYLYVCVILSWQNDFWVKGLYMGGCRGGGCELFSIFIIHPLTCCLLSLAAYLFSSLTSFALCSPNISSHNSELMYIDSGIKQKETRIIGSVSTVHRQKETSFKRSLSFLF